MTICYPGWLYQKTTAVPNKFIFDIEINMDALAGDKVTFYKEQFSEIVTRVSIDIDLTYVAKKKLQFACSSDWTSMRKAWNSLYQ